MLRMPVSFFKHTLNMSAWVQHALWHTAQGSRVPCLAGAGLQHVFTSVTDQHLRAAAAGQGHALQHALRCLLAPVEGICHQLCEHGHRMFDRRH